MLRVEPSGGRVRRMIVSPQEIGNCFLGKSQPVMHAESVRRGAFGIAEFDLRSNTREEPLHTFDEVGARFDDSLALRVRKRVPGRLDHAMTSPYACASSSSASGSKPTM